MHQKMELLDKEKDYYRQRDADLEKQLASKDQLLKHRDIEEAELKKTHEDRLRRMEEDKLSLFTEKNRELTKAMEDNKGQFEEIRHKDSELRKVVYELAISRNTIQKLEGRIKEIQGDRTTHIQAYQAEIEVMRSRELQHKTYRDSIRSNQWNCERETRRLVQHFIKTFIEGGDGQARS